MTPAHVVEIVTPKKVVLNGLWFGPKRPKNVFILVHGLMSSLFSKRALIDDLMDDDSAVLAFNNRGFEIVSGVRQIKNKKGDYTWLQGGCAHEVFTECVDDIDGAVAAAVHHGAENVFLVGHSTGCQKSVYWASKRKGKEGSVRGLILLAPLSDHAGGLEEIGARRLSQLLARAQKMVARGQSHELMPAVAGIAADAQRFVSLYAPDSAEEIFSYAQVSKKPRTYESITMPVLALFAGSDEYSKRPAVEIAQWFAEHSQSRAFMSEVIADTGHSFRGTERAAVSSIRGWITAL